jgi:ubiquinone/menaquinone biosynthesis C-methylase UbiE
MSKLLTLAGTELEIQEIQTWNERMFRLYQSDRLYFHPNFLIRKIQARRIHTILEFLEVSPNDAVLDVGCGEGHLFAHLPRSARRVGIDLCRTALAVAGERNHNVEWIYGDVHCMPFRSHLFDKVCCSEVIEHVLDPVCLIHELFRVVKPTGRVVLTIPTEKALNRVKDLMLSNPFGRQLFPDIPRRTEWHLTEYSPELLQTQVRDLFRIERAKQLPWAWLGLGYGILCTPK